MRNGEGNALCQSCVWQRADGGSERAVAGAGGQGQGFILEGNAAGDFRRGLLDGSDHLVHVRDRAAQG